MQPTATADIARDRTPPAAFYTDPAVLDAELRGVFARSWQLAGHAGRLAQDGDFFTVRIGAEPLLLVNDAGTIRGFFNVCRHRAGPVAQGCGRQRVFACRYHGWTYDRSGQLLRAPEMEGVAGFDPARIALEPVRVHRWGELLFVALDPQTPPFEEYFAGLLQRCAQLGFESMRHVMTRTYPVEANWKVYVDNYLEGYHIPLVHPALNREIDYRGYVTDPGTRHVLQYASVRTDGAQHYRGDLGGGQAFYLWMYPNLMLNVYQGQLQTNIVIPQGVDHTLVQFDWFAPEPLPDLERDARWADLIRFTEEIQAEDAGICAAVQLNLRSRAYRSGPYSVAREQGVHRFHSLMRAHAS